MLCDLCVFDSIFGYFLKNRTEQEQVGYPFEKG
jgi:hypothetical protein